MYQLFCDSNSEIPWTLAEEYGLSVVQMPYILKDVEYKYDLGKNTDFTEFYNQIRAGNMPTTCALNVQDYLDYFQPVLETGTDILMICFSSALSSTYESLQIAISQLLGKYPERTIKAVDTLSISMGAGILVNVAAQMWKNGSSMDEVIAWVEENRQNVQHWFTVDDLNHLRRGGRISGAAAVMGTILEVKPILIVNSEGKIVVFEKVKGRKKALKAVAEHFFENVIAPETQLVSILHADAIEDAKLLAELLKEKCTFKELRIDMVGPVIGAHCGPGTLALCFMGKPRIK